MLVTPRHHGCTQVWLELYRTPSEEDRELVSEVFQSWYMLGRLGGFNGMNMQVDD